MTSRHVSIPVFGIGCAAPSVGRVLSRLSGVMTAYVNPATELAEIEFDGDRISVEQLSQAISGCGFRVGQPAFSGGVFAPEAAQPESER